MITNKIINGLKKISPNMNSIEKGLVYSFATSNAIRIEGLISNYLKDEDDETLQKINAFLSSFKKLTWADLVEAFELLVPNAEKKGKGVVYTPEAIKSFIFDRCIISKHVPYIIDPSCGCGSFLLTAAQYLNKKYRISIKEAVEKYIFGIDIDTDALEKTKILITLLALYNSETPPKKFNLIHADALDKESIMNIRKRLPDGFDCVVGNPPYVRFRNLSDEAKQHFFDWYTSSVGNCDLYMPFLRLDQFFWETMASLGLLHLMVSYKGQMVGTCENIFTTIIDKLKLSIFEMHSYSKMSQAIHVFLSSIIQRKTIEFYMLEVMMMILLGEVLTIQSMTYQISRQGSLGE